MSPQEYHMDVLCEILEDKYGALETPKNERYWKTYWWYYYTTPALVACVRELLQHCNNVEVAEKAWTLLDKLEIGE